MVFAFGLFWLVFSLCLAFGLLLRASAFGLLSAWFWLLLLAFDFGLCFGLCFCLAFGLLLRAFAFGLVLAFAFGL